MTYNLFSKISFFSLAILLTSNTAFAASAPCRNGCTISNSDYITEVSGGFHCGFTTLNKWEFGRYFSSTQKFFTKGSRLNKLLSKADRKSFSRLTRNKLCKDLSAPSGRIASLSQIPSTTSITSAASNGESYLSLFGDFKPSAVSGTPPTLLEIKELNLKELFWRSGVIDAINAGNASAEQCSEFFGSGVDGQSAGFGACYMAQDLGYSFQPVVSAGTSLCYMKNAPTLANLNAGGISLVRGRLPNNDVTQLFSPPAGDSNRLVKVQVRNADFGDEEGGGEEDVLIKVYSVGQNSKDGRQYRVDLLFCNGNTSNGYEINSVDGNGNFTNTSSHEGGGEEGNFAATINAKITADENGDRIFDNTQDRTANISFVSDNYRFKSNITVTGDDIIKNKSYNIDPSSSRKAYSVSSFSGTGLSDLRFLAGAFKDSNPSNSTEYRDSYFAAAPGSDLVSLLDEVDIDSDSFYSTEPSFSESNLGFNCSTSPNIIVSMDMSNETIQNSVAECEENSQFRDMDFCNRSEDLSNAQNNYFATCEAE